MAKPAHGSPFAWQLRRDEREEEAIRQTATPSVPPLPVFIRGPALPSVGYTLRILRLIRGAGVVKASGES